MAEVQVFMLGRFEIHVDGKPIDVSFDNSKKSRLLLQYLLLHRKSAISYRRLYDLLWPSEESANPENALKTLISRLRAALTRADERLSDCILTKSGTYRWNPALDCALDIDAFGACAAALLAEHAATPKARELGARLLMLYAGDLMAEDEQIIGWMVAISLRLHGLYLRALGHYLTLLRQAEDLAAVIATSRAGLRVAPHDERLRVELMDALVRTGAGEEAMAQYAQGSSLHHERLGLRLPAQLPALYEGLARNDEQLAGDLATITARLHAADDCLGAYLCTYEVFECLLTLQVRNLGQSSAPLALMMIRLSDVQGARLAPSAAAPWMDVLAQVLCHHLRCGDAIARHSADQYALLLPTVTYATAPLVVDRVRQAFYEKAGNAPLLLNHRLTMLLAHPIAPDGLERRASQRLGAE